jgi:hypothetical protein
MSQRQILSLSVGVLLLIGIGFASVPFVRSFQRTPAAWDGFPQVELSDLGPGSYQWLGTSNLHALMPEVLVVHDFDGNVRAFELPILDGKYLMPDQDWSHVLGACVNFGPDGTEGQLLRNGTIRCHDPQLPESYRSEWQWTYAGERLGQWSPNLRQLEVVREGDYLSVGR